MLTASQEHTAEGGGEGEQEEGTGEKEEGREGEQKGREKIE